MFPKNFLSWFTWCFSTVVRNLQIRFSWFNVFYVFLSSRTGGDDLTKLSNVTAILASIESVSHSLPTLIVLNEEKCCFLKVTNEIISTWHFNINGISACNEVKLNLIQKMIWSNNKYTISLLQVSLDWFSVSRYFCYPNSMTPLLA